MKLNRPYLLYYYELTHLPPDMGPFRLVLKPQLAQWDRFLIQRDKAEINSHLKDTKFIWFSGHAGDMELGFGYREDVMMFKLSFPA